MARRKPGDAPNTPDEPAPRMATASDGLPKGLRRGNQHMLKLTEAYQAVFTGRATREQAEIVKVDLAAYTGFFMCSPKGTPQDVLQYQEGMRAAFGRVHNFLNLTGEEARRLTEAARAEAIVNNHEGEA